ncbi:hypothetical protein CTRI78_v002886 [Colletotrichum trifolii]|uniref:BTB domain-containing protein n=1 Tax=Colletotrichum trifolii TaxID=5466 RepID=A0A4R8RL54_COLTR|nr:hypothetical protein CTRI78_v002886 [Colletotrichum trifolii]
MSTMSRRIGEPPVRRIVARHVMSESNSIRTHAEQNDWPTVNVVCAGGHSFLVHKRILETTTPPYRSHLRNTQDKFFGAASTFNLPSVKPEYMELYVALAYEQGSRLDRQEGSRGSIVTIDKFASPVTMEALVQFFQLCKKMRNLKLQIDTYELIRIYADWYMDDDEHAFDWDRCIWNFASGFDLLRNGSWEARLRQFLVETFNYRMPPCNLYKHAATLAKFPDFFLQVLRERELMKMLDDEDTREAALSYALDTR